jgi:hypothetical protein
MSKYAIFIDDLEIHVNLKVGTIKSLDTLREELIYTLKDNPKLEEGYAEQYPFYQAEWEIVGSSLPVGFDKTTILEVSL